MVLSDEAVLVYVLAESGVKGRLTAGRIERDPSGLLTVFDAQGTWFEYLSGKRLRSWYVIGPDGKPLDGWREILPMDFPEICA
jgi:hypothetical protein